jgi:hypothetical protein
MCVTDRLAKPTVELAARQDDLLRMNCLDGIQWDHEVTGIFDVNGQLSAVRGDVAH